MKTVTIENYLSPTDERRGIGWLRKQKKDKRKRKRMRRLRRRIR